MSLGQRGLTIIAAALVVASGALAWTDHGETEPNSGADTADVMWQEAADRGGSRVYFNAYPAAFATSANPNSASLGTRLAFPLLQWQATLGVWRDCNGDGAIGLGETGMAEYPVALLDAEGLAACPAGSRHELQGQVIELLHVGINDDGPPGQDPRVLYADDTTVWGDQVRFVPARCGYWPWPSGTTARTGGIIEVADCVLGEIPVAAVNALDHDGSLGLRMDGRPSRSDGALNQDLPVHPYDDPQSGRTGFFEDDSGDAAFTAWDCADAGGFEPTLHNPHGSLWDGIENAWDGAAEDCDPSTPSRFDALHLDLEPEWTSDSARRFSTDLLFTFVDDGSAAPDGGVGAARGSTGPAWRASVIHLTQNNVVGSPTTSPLKAPQEWRFYAHLDLAALPGVELPPADPSRSYGDEECPWWQGGEHWECDPTRWYGWGTMSRYDDGPRPGDAYHLRDVDCVDRSAGTGVAFARRCG